MRSPRPDFNLPFLLIASPPPPPPPQEKKESPFSNPELWFLQELPVHLSSPTVNCGKLNTTQLPFPLWL